MKIYLTVLALFLATNSFAASKDIVSGGTGANFVYAQNSNDDYKTTFNLITSYDHVYDSGLQLGATAELTYTSGSNQYLFLVGPGYNLTPDDVANSIYFSVKAGMIRVDGKNYTETEVTAIAEAGKRFKLTENVSYAPAIRVAKVFADNAKDPAYALDLFKFSFLFN